MRWTAHSQVLLRWAFILAALLLSLLSLAKVAQAKDVDVRLDKLKKLAQSSPDGMARLNSKRFNELIVTPDRPYTSVVVFTALDKQLGCKYCWIFDEESRKISRYWKKHGDLDRIVFGMLDYQDGQEIFRQMGLDNVPRLFVFPADTGPHKSKDNRVFEVNIVNKRFNGNAVADVLSQELGVQMGIDELVDHTKTLAYGSIGLAVVYFGYHLYRHLGRSTIFRNVTGIATLVFILLMSSGFMWCRINSPQYIGMSRNGEPALFANGNQQQYGIETQIVSALYAICAISVIGLTVQVPKIKAPEKRTFMAFVWLIVLIATFSYFNVAFRVKIPSYPYKLLLP
ncbi:oligosaccharyl transferase subunit ost3/OST6 [Spiromyces aspiralis]|uniref:Oligosaccharyl transferase subunit ost3/OST6 n=1 Tax=Spiromyces aspiralis TaxID=68401 RepID=A0ACC1HXY0_9FUNG|nr:oligosaccharyl transferase subunit ost3/OST6 [Spiromyces aspiralis]